MMRLPLAAQALIAFPDANLGLTPPRFMPASAPQTLRNKILTPQGQQNLMRQVGCYHLKPVAGRRQPAFSFAAIQPSATKAFH